MGSTSTTIDQGTNVRAYFDAELTRHSPGRTITASNVAPIPGATRHNEWQHAYYAAVREPDGETWAAVTTYSRKNIGGYNLHYKDLTETMGVQAEGAAAKVLDALTPTDSETAQRWRAEARAYLDARKTKPKPKIGDTIRFERPIPFTDGTERDTFVFAVKRTTTYGDGRKRVKTGLQDPDSGWWFVVPKWRERALTIIGSGRGQEAA